MNAGSGGPAACSTRGAQAMVRRRADTDDAGGAGRCEDHAGDDHAGSDAGANDLRP